MKVAVCLSGQPRTISRVWKSLYENLLSRFDCELFIHTPEPYPVKTDFWETTKPCLYCVEPPTTITQSALQNLYFNQSTLNGYIQQIHGYLRVWQLKEQHHSGYDLVIRTRPDLEYLRPISLDMFDLSAVNMFPRAIDTERNQCGTDVFAIGPELLMKNVFTVLTWIEQGHLRKNEWTRRLPEENVRCLNGRHCPETIMSSCLDHQQVPYRHASIALEEVIRINRHTT